MKVGFVLPQSPEEGGETWRDIMGLAQQAEAGGIDSLWVCDHFVHYAPDGSETGYHEAMVLLAALAASTTRVELGSLVLATSFRSPSLLAKMAATLDEVSGQRLILGLGCGWHEPEYRAFGFPFDQRVGRFEEALSIIAPLVRGERVTLAGRWSEVHDAVLLPALARPDLPILVAADGERMMRLTARYADVWQSAWYGPPDDRWRTRRDRFREACEAEGRDFESVALTVGLDVRPPPADTADTAQPGYLPLEAAALAQGLTAWAAEGVHHVQLGLEELSPEAVDIVLDAVARFRA